MNQENLPDRDDACDFIAPWRRRALQRLLRDFPALLPLSHPAFNEEWFAALPVVVRDFLVAYPETSITDVAVALARTAVAEGRLSL